MYWLQFLLCISPVSQQTPSVPWHATLHYDILDVTDGACASGRGSS